MDVEFDTKIGGFKSTQDFSTEGKEMISGSICIVVRDAGIALLYE